MTLLQPDVPSWKGSRRNSTGGYHVNVCGPCGFRLPDDFEERDGYTCPNCGTVFPRTPRARRKPPGAGRRGGGRPAP